MIWHFETQFAAAASELLKKAVALLACGQDQDLFVLGVHIATGSPWLLRPGQATTARELVGEFTAIADMYSPFPADYEMPREEWIEQFKKHEESCRECWLEIREAVSTHLEGKLVLMSPCCEINGYLVTVVVTTARIHHDSFPTLDLSVYDNTGRWPSLHFALYQTVLDHLHEELMRRDAGRAMVATPEIARELIRRAGMLLMRTHAWHNKAFSRIDVQVRGVMDLFSACNVIAAMRYEGQEAHGEMLVVDRDHRAVECIIRFDPSVFVTEHRRMRKLLETCRGGLSLLSNSRQVWGIGRLTDAYDADTVEAIAVRFAGHGRWELWHQEQELMRVEHGEPRLPTAPMTSAEIEESVKGFFTRLGLTECRSSVLSVIQDVLRARCGTTLVITPEAERQCKRLAGKQGGIAPFVATAEAIKGAASIDGAIVIDTAGRCYGMGLILDGTACPHEDPARGARYNSAWRYCQQLQHECLILVCSEDGMIDFIPL